MSAVEEELVGTSLDIDVVGLTDITEFKSDSDLYDFDSGNEFGLFGEAGAELQSSSEQNSNNSGSSSGTAGLSSSSGSSFSESRSITKTSYYEDPVRLSSLAAASSISRSSGSSQGEGPSVSSRVTGPCGKKTARFKSGAAPRRTGTWTIMEKDLFQKGLDLIGPNWKKLSRFISTKSPSHIKSYHRKWAETANVIQDSSMDNFSVSYVMVPTSPGLDLLLDDPLGILQTATTTVRTTPFNASVTAAKAAAFDVSSLTFSNCHGDRAIHPGTVLQYDINITTDTTVDIQSTTVRTTPYDIDTSASTTTECDVDPSISNANVDHSSPTTVVTTFSHDQMIRNTGASSLQSNSIPSLIESLSTRAASSFSTATSAKRKKKIIDPNFQDETGRKLASQLEFTISNSAPVSREDIRCGNSTCDMRSVSTDLSIIHDVTDKSYGVEFNGRGVWICGDSGNLLGESNHDAGHSVRHGASASTLLKKCRKKTKKKDAFNLSKTKGKSNVSKLSSKRLNPSPSHKFKRKISLKKCLANNRLNNNYSLDNSRVADLDSFAALEGQVIRIVKADIDDDGEIDIDVCDSEQLEIEDGDINHCLGKAQSLINNAENSVENNICIKSTSRCKEGDHERKFINESFSFNSENVVCVIENDHICFSFSKPDREAVFSHLEMSEEENKIHFEYFAKKGVKTPERYLKIRNAILDIWQQCRPNYLGKTFARKSIKNGGDVNSIGKIHDYLEKKGAINFGCSESKYDTPLIIPMISVKSRQSSKMCASNPHKLDRSYVSRHTKNRLRAGLTEGGGLTIRHDDSGAVVDAYHVPEAPKQRSHSKYCSSEAVMKNEQFRLIKCLEYDHSRNPAPFCLTLHPQAVATMDLHAHSSVAEVMGLVGGYYEPVLGSVHVTVAVPTRATASGFECDMCPLSQGEACVRVQEYGVQVIGWYHSHPTFPANPSLQDVETQADLQDVFAKTNSPFVGIIISPFCPTNRTESSQIQCLILDHAAENVFSLRDDRGPYKLDWEVSGETPEKWTDLSKVIREVVVGAGGCNNNSSALGGCRDLDLGVVWRKEWKVNLTYWEKAIRSLELLLPQHMTHFVQLVRQAFITAIKDQMGDR